jgi:hypothetical protein
LSRIVAAFGGSIQRLAVIGAVGAVVGLGLFVATSWTGSYSYLGPLCRTETVDNPHVDPWTGGPRGGAFICDSSSLRPTLTTELRLPYVVRIGPPDDIADRRAIPIPLAFTIGIVAATLWFIRRDARERRAAPA